MFCENFQLMGGGGWIVLKGAKVNEGKKEKNLVNADGHSKRFESFVGC